MSNYHHPDEDQFRKWDAAPPSVTEHGTEDDIRDKLKPMLPSKWKMEGNQLIAETENGTHAQTIPTDYILESTDEKTGLPIFRKIKV